MSEGTSSGMFALKGKKKTKSKLVVIHDQSELCWC